MNPTANSMLSALLADPHDEATLRALADLLTDIEPADRIELLAELFRRASGAGLQGPRMSLEHHVSPGMAESAIRLSMRAELGRELVGHLLDYPTAQVSVIEDVRVEESGYTRTPHRVVRITATIRPLLNAGTGPVPMTFYAGDAP